MNPTLKIQYINRPRLWREVFILSLMVNSFAMAATASTAVEIPAFTAYANEEQPAKLKDRNWRQRVRISEDNGITNWKGDAESVSWFGQFSRDGIVECHINWTPAADGDYSFELEVLDQLKTVHVNEAVAGSSMKVDLGSFTIPEGTGYAEFRLRSKNGDGTDNGRIESLVLVDPDASMVLEDFHFNPEPRRNAASVHLFYPVDRDVEVAAFYCEMKALEDPVWSYYMATGWHRGYFGMQVNSDTERRIIFSVWDSGDEAIDRGRVADENRVKLVARGEGVHTNDFGNEGTGGHSHLKYMWKTGTTQKFVVTARPVDGRRTIFSGYYFHPDKNEWMLISSWNAPKDGGYLRGLYSFSENFVGANGHLLRKALYGNQWIRDSSGRWIELTEAGFSHDPTGRTNRLDRFMGLEDGQFFLSHGGFVNGYTEYGKRFTRKAVGVPPELELPSPDTQ